MITRGLADRRGIGSQFHTAIQRTRRHAEAQSMHFAAAWADAKPDFVYVLVSVRGIDHQELFNRCGALLLGALAQYKMRAGMFIADRDGKSYEVGLRADIPMTPEAIAFGHTHFGHLKITTRRSTIVPEENG